jgi:hypothetical protein
LLSFLNVAPSLALFASGVGHRIGDLCGKSESSDTAEQVKNSDWSLIHFTPSFFIALTTAFNSRLLALFQSIAASSSDANHRVDSPQLSHAT